MQVKDSVPSRADRRQIQKTIQILDEFERQQRTRPQPINPQGSFNAANARNALVHYLMAYDL